MCWLLLRAPFPLAVVQDRTICLVSEGYGYQASDALVGDLAVVPSIYFQLVRVVNGNPEPLNS